MSAYPSDLTDVEWEILKKEVPKERRGGRHRSVSVREILNAVFYVLDNGDHCRMIIPNSRQSTGISINGIKTARLKNFTERRVRSPE